MLSFAPESILSVPRIKSLQHYRELMVEARASLAQPALHARQLARQQKIFSACSNCWMACRQGPSERPALESFTRQMAPLLLANVADATAVEMRELYLTAAAWQRQLSPAEWAALHVVMIGPHMPRDQEASIQFFERLFQELRRAAGSSTRNRFGKSRTRLTCWPPMWWTKPRARLSSATRCACTAICWRMPPGPTWMRIRSSVEAAPSVMTGGFIGIPN